MGYQMPNGKRNKLAGCCSSVGILLLRQNFGEVRKLGKGTLEQGQEGNWEQ